jgi:cytochrome b6-f complex iron-sulfur subunit
MEQRVEAVSDSTTSRRHFIDLLLGASILGWLASIAYPVIRYLKPLPQNGPTGPTRLTREETAKLEQDKFVIVPVSGQRVIVLQSPDQKLLAFSSKCTHEGCTVTFLPSQSIIWCPCHDGRYDLHGRVLSGPPPKPLPEYAVQRQPDGGIVISEKQS